jgi:hypothetical protein
MLDKRSNITSILLGISLTVFGKKIQELTTSTNEGEIEFIEITGETVTASLNAVAHMVFSKERFMKKSE